MTTVWTFHPIPYSGWYNEWYKDHEKLLLRRNVLPNLVMSKFKHKFVMACPRFNARQRVNSHWLHGKNDCFVNTRFQNVNSHHHYHRHHPILLVTAKVMMAVGKRHEPWAYSHRALGKLFDSKTRATICRQQLLHVVGLTKSRKHLYHIMGLVDEGCIMSTLHLAPGVTVETTTMSEMPHSIPPTLIK